MATTQCTICHGIGNIDTGNHENCYSCGGSGHGSHTNVPCTSCSGSGKSCSTIKETCWNCHGSGTIHKRDAPKPRPPKTDTKVKPTTVSGKSKATTKKPSSVLESIQGISAVLAVIAMFFVFPEAETILHIGLVGVGSFGLSFVGLYIIYYAIKLAVGILEVAFGLAFYGAIVIVGANLLGFEWAEKIVNAVL